MNDKRISRWLKAGIIFSLAVSVFSGITVYTQWSRYARADSAYHALQERSRQTASSPHAADALPEKEADVPCLRPLKDFTELKQENEEIVGWLSCEGTVIDYPVMHTDNNEFYLHHLYNGESNPSGALFVDYRNNGAFTDRNTVIYGHNMKNDTMFSVLNSYKNQEYYDEHPVLMLYTPEETYLVELLSGTLEDGTQEFIPFAFETEEAFLEYIEDLQNRSTFRSRVQISPGDRLVSLCTCSYEWTNARYLVVGRLSPAV